MNQNQYDVDAAWSKVRKRVMQDDQAEGMKISTKKRERTASYTGLGWKIAAASILLLAVGYILVSRYDPSSSGLTRKISHESAPDSERSVALPDGSVVQLNAGSKIAFSKGMEGTTRKVSLTGEAFFDVSHHAGRPFIVLAENARIRVLGTSFNIKTNVPSDEVKVFVESGSVELADRTLKTAAVILEAGETGKVTGSSVERITAKDPNVLSWKTKILVFQETEMRKVLPVLNNTFHTEISYADESIGSLRFTGNFNKQPVDTVLEVLCTAFNLTAVNRNGTIMLAREN